MHAAGEKKLENVDVTLTEQIPVPSVPFLKLNRLLNTQEVIQQGSVYWGIYDRQNVAEKRGRYCDAEERWQTGWLSISPLSSTPLTAPAEGSGAAEQGTLCCKLLVGHHQRTKEISPNLPFPLVQLPWAKLHMEKHGIYFTWLALARVVKQEKQKEKTYKQIQQSITQDLSGLEAVKTPEHLAWLKVSLKDGFWNVIFE